MDVITYCPSPTLYLAEVKIKAPKKIYKEDKEEKALRLEKENKKLPPGQQKKLEDEPDQEKVIGVTKTPSKRRADGATLALVRDLPADLTGLDNLVVLGTYEEIFADPAKLAIYDSVYDRTPRDVDDGEGGTITITPPDKLGVFL
jgi:hypothetical protein